MSAFNINNKRLLLAARVLLCLNAGFWLVSGLLRLLTHLSGFSELAFYFQLLPFLMMANGLVFLFFGFTPALHSRRIIHLAAIAFVGLNAFLSVTDQIGILDLICLLINLGTFLLLLLTHLRKDE
ncbi:MAG: hypothetical protein JW750_05490 [Anaerolineaceae bacterium]|nr:hypothetical protein [Anaerolineaceae bacterium]